MSRWLVARTVSFRPRDLWGTAPSEIRKFLFHPSDVIIDYMTVSLSGQYPRPANPGAGGWSLDVSLMQLTERGMKRINLDESSKTFVRTDEPFLRTTELFDAVDPSAPLFVVFKPNNFLDPSTVPRDFEVHVTVNLLVDQTQ